MPPAQPLTRPAGVRPPPPCPIPNAREAGDPVGYQLGWDHALLGLTPPAEHLLPGHPVGAGWQDGCADLGPRRPPVPTRTRLGLGRRLQAWGQQAPQAPLPMLQARLGQALLQPGWSQPWRQWVETLPSQAQRRDAQVWVQSLWARWLGLRQQHGLPAGPAAQQERLAQAWASPVVQRRWQRLASQWDEATIQGLLARAHALGLGQDLGEAWPAGT